MNKTVFACFLPVFLLAGCGPEKLPPEKQKHSAELAIDRSRIESKISSAYLFDKTYLPARYGNATGISPLVSSSERDVVFGLREGLTKNQIEERGVILLPVEGQRNFYGTTSLSENNKGFERFFLTISPQAGLCIVQGVGASVETDSYGMMLKQKFQERAALLDAAYGEGQKTDVLLDGSIWKAPSEWMMGLKKQQRILSEAWDARNEGLQRHHLKSVYMESVGVNMTSGYFVLKYMFNNVDVCIKEYRQSKGGQAVNSAVSA